ncbi:hypothetical protein ABW19_dt0209761 [Dactylella cylindrospora]|nr:hypothetical protein ABW19_dt0209761 [Dactylella cylindrospora]
MEPTSVTSVSKGRKPVNIVSKPKVQHIKEFLSEGRKTKPTSNTENKKPKPKKPKKKWINKKNKNKNKVESKPKPLTNIPAPASSENLPVQAPTSIPPSPSPTPSDEPTLGDLAVSLSNNGDALEEYHALTKPEYIKAEENDNTEAKSFDEGEKALETPNCSLGDSHSDKKSKTQEKDTKPIANSSNETEKPVGINSKPTRKALDRDPVPTRELWCGYAPIMTCIPEETDEPEDEIAEDEAVEDEAVEDEAVKNEMAEDEMAEEEIEGSEEFKASEELKETIRRLEEEIDRLQSWPQVTPLPSSPEQNSKESYPEPLSNPYQDPRPLFPRIYPRTYLREGRHVRNFQIHKAVEEVEKVEGGHQMAFAATDVPSLDQECPKDQDLLQEECGLAETSWSTDGEIHNIYLPYNTQKEQEDISTISTAELTSQTATDPNTLITNTDSTTRINIEELLNPSPTNKPKRSITIPKEIQDWTPISLHRLFSIPTLSQVENWTPITLDELFLSAQKPKSKRLDPTAADFVPPTLPTPPTSCSPTSTSVPATSPAPLELPTPPPTPPPKAKKAKTKKKGRRCYIPHLTLTEFQFAQLLKGEIKLKFGKNGMEMDFTWEKYESEY